MNISATYNQKISSMFTQGKAVYVVIPAIAVILRMYAHILWYNIYQTPAFGELNCLFPAFCTLVDLGFFIERTGTAEAGMDSCIELTGW
ncbi:MAG: hypothetical protein M1381_05105 [Deltaproteobacteria bacterium]|nr:hypothetical protein [Deltaproteobacteria bacterium]MCL5791602.1 hypothetical protein [Deltaproteobacteria bacterium]